MCKMGMSQQRQKTWSKEKRQKWRENMRER